MNTLRRLLPAFAVAPLCLALRPAADEVSFHPEDGSSLTKKFQIDATFTLDDMTLNVNGQDMSEMAMQNAEDTDLEVFVHITDQYVAVADGKPLELIRSFDDIGGSVKSGEESTDIEGIDKIKSQKVRFKWNDESKEYDVAFHEGEGDSDMLEQLAEDMDLRTLLPDRAVADGDKWSVTGKEIQKALFAGMKSDGFGSAVEDETAQLVIDQLLPQVEKVAESFEMNCTYKGTREEGGARVGVLELQLVGKPSLDLASTIEELIKKVGDEQQVEIDASVKKATVACDVEGAGSMLWNNAKGHVHAFDMTSTIKFNVEAAVSVDAQGEKVELEMALEMSGKIHWQVATE